MDKNNIKKLKKLLIKIGIGIGTILIIILIIKILFSFSSAIFNREPPENSNSPKISEKTNLQIYPNYYFPGGTNEIKVFLIPSHQALSREAGGWVFTPRGSEYRIDFENPINIEYIDGRIIHSEPGKPTWAGVRPANSVFRIYGEEKEIAIVTIKRNQY